MRELTVKINAKKESSYPIIIGENLIENIDYFLEKYAPSKRYLVVTNETIYELYKDIFKPSNSEFCILPDGEKYKNFETLQSIITKALELNLERKDSIIAFGGGVIGDMAGFAASIYQRGIDFIQVPTTLLAQVDSSVGGKVGINHPLGKNMVGNFYQPKLVLADINTLKTLDLRQLKTGLAEVVKYAFIENSCGDEKTHNLFKFLEENKENIYNLEKKSLTDLIEICCSLKAAVVNQDEKEKGIRAILNFGHTYAHAIEKVTKYEKYTHGEAVAIGMKMALETAHLSGLINENYVKKGLSLIKKYDIGNNIDEQLHLDDIYNAMKLDKKVEDKKIRFVLPSGYKEVKISDSIEESTVKSSINKHITPLLS